MNDFKREYAALKQEIDSSLLEVCSSGWFILGEQVKLFEKEFAAYLGAKHVIGVANGLEALQIGLMAMGIKAGDEVITVANTAVATALAISFTGATPVFVDIDSHYHLDPDKLRAAITPRTKAILPVHLFGQMVDMAAIKKIAAEHDIPVVEDACQAHGAQFEGAHAGTMGLFGASSFYPTKNLGGYGDGGAIITNDDRLFEQCMMMRNYGQKNRYVHLIKGLNSRLDEMQAAILRVKLKHLSQWVTRRQELAAQYTKGLSGLRQITITPERKNAVHAYHLYVVAVEKRDELMAHLKSRGIESLVHYPVPIHKQQCYREFEAVSLLHTEEAASRIISLPINPYLTSDEVNQIVSEVISFYSSL